MRHGGTGNSAGALRRPTTEQKAAIQQAAVRRNRCRHGPRLTWKPCHDCVSLVAPLGAIHPQNVFGNGRRWQTPILHPALQNLLGKLVILHVEDRLHDPG